MKSFPKWVLGILVLVFLFRIPSLFEPYYYGDEMIYMNLGQGVRQGLTLYKDVHDNKPPLLYLLATLSENLFIFKAILGLWSMVTVALFYKLSAKMFVKNSKIQKISTLLFAFLTTIPLFEGNIVNSELFMIGFSILAFLILLSEGLNSKRILLAGALFGTATLFKIPAAFDLPIIIVYWFITSNFKDWKTVIKNSFILVLGFLIPILLSLAWSYTQGVLPEYIKAAFLQNVGYLSSYRPGDVQKSFLVKNGPLLLRATVVSVGILLLYLSRKKLSKNFILLSIWILLGLFGVTLSERPYPHYFIQVIAPISLLLSILFAEKSVEQSLTVIPLMLAFIVPFYYKFYYYQTGSYYLRFINFASGNTTKEVYFQGFSGTTNRNYQIANFISESTKSTDRVFMWDSDSAIVYALSRRLPPIRYVADYHVYDFSTMAEVANILTNKPPKFIILTSGHPYPHLENLLKTNYLLVTQIENANIYSRLYSIEAN